MLFFAFIKLLFAAILFLGTAALGMMAFRAIRRRAGFHPYAMGTAQGPQDWTAKSFNQATSAPIIVLGEPLRRPVTLTMRQRTIEVK